MNSNNILLRHNYIDIPSANETIGQEALATVLVNLSYYGYALDVGAYKAVLKLGPKELTTWWPALEKELKEITGESRKIGDFVVYKNFPAEVLAKSEAEYWIPQILMYWGFPNELFTEQPVPRAKMDEKRRPKILRRSSANTTKDILNSYLCAAARWKSQEFDDVLALSELHSVNFAKLAFKENLVALVASFMSRGQKIKLNTATDVLRLAAGLSSGDVSLRENTKFKSFKKPERRFILSMLEGCGNIKEDMARRPEMWKRLIHQLHPGDYRNRYKNVCEAMDFLYKDNLVTFNSRVEGMLSKKDPAVLALLAERPGEFRRRLAHTLNLFGDKAVKAFIADDVIGKLTTTQVVSLRAVLDMANKREHRTFPPKGNWTKLQLGDVRKISEKHVKSVSKALGKVLAERMPAVTELDEATLLIKLASNDGEVSAYTRGTAFPIPDDVEFIRTASYWKVQRAAGTYGNVWFDNGWNFFDSNWNDLGVCCWNQPNFKSGSSIFSGDPTNSKEMQGRAAQLIDLYPKKLVAAGVRYAVWNILCYSRIPFSKAEDVFAALQWGEDPQKGKLFEPSRCQLSFPLKGESFTKYICLLDLNRREMVYLDANLRANTSSASLNGKTLQENMPAFMEYIESLPSVYDLFCESKVDKKKGLRVLYSDKDTKLNGESAYVFRQENKDNKYKSVDINSLLT